MSPTPSLRAASVVSTGQGGAFFEQHVDALFLALLLVRAPLPILKDSQVEEVHLQTRRLGWQTDDLLVVAVRPDGVRRQLAVQVKRQFAVSEADDTCTATLHAFWADFRSAEFNPDSDRLALVTLWGTKSLLDALSSLLDCARASRNQEDFLGRLAVKGLLSKDAKRHARTIRRILDGSDTPPTDEQFWRFLSILHVLCFDLNTASAQTEAWIKTLLAMTAGEADQMAVAEASWRELLAIVSSGMPTGASFTYADLPEDLRKRHVAIETPAARVMRRLAEHSAITLEGIRTTIGGGVQIARGALIITALKELTSSQVVLISGPAGSGKSAVARECVSLLNRDLHCFAFRAEEFAVSHIDQTLLNAQVELSASELFAMLAGQGRKLVLVDSIERLLESPTRGAFADLLELARKDPNLGLLITCRDYSLQTVAAALLDRVGLAYRVVEVPPLSDGELLQVVAALPELSRALQHPGLNRLLRSPYLLDIAAQMDWADTRSLPTSEWEFRKRCWREVIRREAASGGGMPHRRERAFEEVALRRARELRPHVPVEHLDADVLDALRNDGLIVYSPESTTMAAPAHDVLEDWAIVQWLDRRWRLHERAPGPFADDIGAYPAIRRAYRKWLSEALLAEAEPAADFVMSVFRDAALPAFFRDDTLVCALQSASARDLLNRHREALFADGAQLLARVIHLTRVACKTPVPWVHDGIPAVSQLLTPEGEAWPVVLELVLGGIDRLLPQQIPSLLGLLEDFCQSISHAQPEPRGYEDAASIAFRILEHLGDYGSDEMRKRALRVIAKVPRGDEASFRALLDRAIAAEDRNHLGEEVAELLLSGLDGWLACRHFPCEVIRLAESRLFLREEALHAHYGFPGGLLGVEPFFGIPEHPEFRWFPPSAARGVFLPLLRYHPQQGVDFIIRLLNYAGRWYGERLWGDDALQAADEITIEIPGDAPIKQWANSRLWGLYRGHTVGPHVLQCALMALEAWLLEIARHDNLDLEGWLLKILKASGNVMATAVVASVCNAYPAKAGRAGLAVLSSRELIELDRSRMVHEQAHSGMFERFRGADIAAEVYKEERRRSDALSHRGHDLEALAIKIQLTEHRDAVLALLDKHRAALPPQNDQSNEDRLWRLALHRMDIRAYQPAVAGASDARGEHNVPTPRDEEPPGPGILLQPSEPEPDLRELVEQYAPVLEQIEHDLSLIHWGVAAWQRRESTDPDTRKWRTYLSEARARDAGPEPVDYARGGPGLIAAVCVRDHWDEMSSDDRAWCIDKLIREVERDCDSQDYERQVARAIHSPDRFAAFVLPSLRTRDLSEPDLERINGAVAKALTHAVDEVVEYAAEGVAATASQGTTAYLEACAAAIALQARLISRRLAEERSKPFGEHADVGEIRREVAPAVRTAIMVGGLDAAEELVGLNLDEWPWTRAADIILRILGQAPDSALAVDFHHRIASGIVQQYDRRVEERGTGYGVDHAFAFESFHKLAAFILKLDEGRALHVCEPLLAAVGKHPREIARFVRYLVSEADRGSGDDCFWAVWQALATSIRAASWIEDLDAPYCPGRELVDAIFLAGPWKENVRHWPRLEGEGHRVDGLAASFRGSAAVFGAYSRFLYTIGERSLPDGFVILAESLEAGMPTAMLADQGTVSVLEVLLGRHVYAEPHKLKSKPAVRRAVLALLDHLVEAGSSAAYRMRDDFVTPLSGRTS